MKISRILVVVAALTLAVAMVVGAASTGAWFSDTEDSTGNTFTAGTLSMEIADSDEGWNDGAPVTASWQSPDGWAPGETITTGVIRLRNVGNIDIRYLFTTFHSYAYTGADLGNVIKVVEYWEYIPGHGWIQNIGEEQKLEEGIGDQTAPLTLRELVDAWWAADTTWIDYATGDNYDTVPAGQAAIEVGGVYETYLKLELMGPEATDPYQGATCSFDIQYEGVQDIPGQKH